VSPTKAQLASCPESLIVGLARTGDRAAFEELVDRRQPWVRSLMRRCCGDTTLADDLAQQVFLQAWKDLPRLRIANRFPGWLKQLAINIWRQHYRAGDALRDAVDVEPPLQTAQVDGLALDLDLALASLGPDERLCVVLSYHEGMTHEEISRAVALPMGTVKSHIRRGAERLRHQLSDYATSESGGSS
jgi:RNA polymerase sigma-70 factor, ECF subfamily